MFGTVYRSSSKKTTTVVVTTRVGFHENYFQTFFTHRRSLYRTKPPFLLAPLLSVVPHKNVVVSGIFFFFLLYYLFITSFKGSENR